MPGQSAHRAVLNAACWPVGMMQCFKLTSVGLGDENKVAYSILSCLPSLENAGQRGLRVKKENQECFLCH